MRAEHLTYRWARELRRGMSLPEVVLWKALRKKQVGGARFRRQHPLGPYILDFYCSAVRLAIWFVWPVLKAGCFPEKARTGARLRQRRAIRYGASSHSIVGNAIKQSGADGDPTVDAEPSRS